MVVGSFAAHRNECPAPRTRPLRRCIKCDAAVTSLRAHADVCPQHSPLDPEWEPAICVIDQHRNAPPAVHIDVAGGWYTYWDDVSITPTMVFRQYAGPNYRDVPAERAGGQYETTFNASTALGRISIRYWCSYDDPGWVNAMPHEQEPYRFIVEYVYVDGNQLTYNEKGRLY